MNISNFMSGKKQNTKKPIREFHRWAY